MRFRRRKAEEPSKPAAGSEKGPTAETTATAAAAAAPPAVERMTAVEWARKHQMNAVMAERAAMYAGKRSEPLTEEEFLAMIRRTDV